MSSAYNALLTLHTGNRWLVLVIGGWTLAQLLWGLLANRAFTLAFRRSIALFAGDLYLQAFLGMVLFGLMRSQNLPIFPGHSAVLGKHISGGAFAILCATVAYAISRREAVERAKYRLAAVCAGLALLAAGKLPIALAVVGLSLLVQVVFTKIENRHLELPRMVRKGSK